MTQAHRKRGRKPGVCLTPRDLEILKEVSPGEVLQLAWVHEKYFPGKPRRAAWHRMTRLTNAGYLQECRGDRGCLLGWFLPRSGTRAPVYRTSYDHDVRVNDVLEVFMRLPIFRSFRPSRDLASQMMRDAWKAGPAEKDRMRLGIPDALIQVEVQGKPTRIALEVEMTRKTKPRLVQKFEALTISDRWDWVFFVARGESLLELVQRVEGWTAEYSWRVKMAQQQRCSIYFCDLETLLKEGANAIWKSRTDALKLSQLQP